MHHLLWKLVFFWLLCLTLARLFFLGLLYILLDNWEIPDLVFSQKFVLVTWTAWTLDKDFISSTFQRLCPALASLHLFCSHHYLPSPPSLTRKQCLSSHCADHYSYLLPHHCTEGGSSNQTNEDIFLKLPENLSNLLFFFPGEMDQV